MKRNNAISARNIAYLSVLTALVIVLQAVGGAITLGTVSLNFTLIPIVLGAVLLGPVAGAFLGLACGVVVLIQVMTGAGFYSIIWLNSPVVTLFTCLLKTTVAGYVAGIAYQFIAKKSPVVAMFVCAGIVPVLNTLIFVAGCLCMSDAVSLFATSLGSEYAGMNVLIFILVVIVTFNFFFEFAINLLLAPALVRVTQVVEKQTSKRRGK